MACFLVPTAEAVVTTITTKVIEKKENEKIKNENHESRELKGTHTNRFSRKLKWLNNMLWGGSALLAFEHFWHGEITPFFPFLTAASDKEEMSQVLHEMSTVGVTMAVAITVIWAGMVVVSSLVSKRDTKEVVE